MSPNTSKFISLLLSLSPSNVLEMRHTGMADDKDKDCAKFGPLFEIFSFDRLETACFTVEFGRARQYHNKWYYSISFYITLYHFVIDENNKHLMNRLMMCYTGSTLWCRVYGVLGKIAPQSSTVCVCVCVCVFVCVCVCVCFSCVL